MEIGAQHFKTVPSNPHYFFYCLPSSKKEVRYGNILAFHSIPFNDVENAFSFFYEIGRQNK